VVQALFTIGAQIQTIYLKRRFIDLILPAE